MVIELGSNPWILIGLTFLELLFIIVPCFLASRIEKVPFQIELKEIGLKISKKLHYKSIIKLTLGLFVGFFFYFSSGYINFWIIVLVIQPLLGSEFVNNANQGAINTRPLQPNILQLFIIILLQIFIVAICEEAFFRGFLISKMEKKINVWITILISSTIFSLYHVPPFLVPLTTTITFFGYYFIFGIFVSS
jgi:membrane protease YdiL (CAAX protease family)